MGGVIGGLILAAGAGRRARPHDKLLMRDAEGHTMIGRTVANTSASALDHVLLVLGHDAARIRDACPGVPWVLATDHAEGLAASLRRGLQEAVGSGWTAAVVCLGDMPLVPPALIDRLIACYRATDPPPDAVVPRAAGTRGNPVLWDRRMFADLLALQGDTGARGLIERPETRLAVVDTDDPAVLQDFDTPDRLAVFASAASRPPRAF